MVDIQQEFNEFELGEMMFIPTKKVLDLLGLEGILYTSEEIKAIEKLNREKEEAEDVR